MVWSAKRSNTSYTPSVPDVPDIRDVPDYRATLQPSVLSCSRPDMARTDMFHGLNRCLVTGEPAHPLPIISDASQGGHFSASQ